MIDWSASADCSDCGVPAGFACEPGCSTFASDDLPLLVSSSAVLSESALLGAPLFSDDPFAPVDPALAFPEPF